MKKMLLILSLISLFFISGLSAEFVSLNSTATKAVSVNILESNDDYTVVEILLNNFTKEPVMIDNQEYLQINLKSEGMRLEKGNPALPVLGRSLMIPAQANMKLEVLSTSYKEFEGKIAPSKGELLRNVNPADIPFEFSEVYKQDSFFPENLVELGEPYILREIRGIAFRVSPFAYNPVQNIIRYYDRITLKVFADGIDTVNTLSSRSNKVTKDFVNLYKGQFLNYSTVQSRYETIEEHGSILVISFPAFMDAMQPFVEWKNQKGIPTVMVPVTEAGTTHAAIKTYIENYWAENPELAFVQLVGDAAQIPTPTFAGGGSDPSYVMLAGDDHYPDMFIGRFSAETVAQVETQVYRTIYYERDIVDGEWLSKSMGLASNEGPGDNGEYDHQHLNIIRDLLLDYTYDHVDQFYEPQANVNQVINALNNGRGFVNYTGHGDQTIWVTTGFSNNNINALTNDYMLPHIVSVACVNGDFTSTTCFAEAWLRATNNATGAPTGAVVTYMATINQPWYPPMRAQDVIVELLVEEEKNTIGGLYFNGSSAMLDAYPNTQGINTMRTWHIFGDASLQVRSMAPLEMVVDAPETFFLGLTEYAVSVDVADALIGLYRPDTQELLGSAYTDVAGEAVIILDEPLDEPCTLFLTVSAYNRITEVISVAVIPNEGPYLVYNSVSFPEGQGPDFGTTTNLNVTVYNVGSEDAQNITATLISNDQYITIVNNQANIEMVGSEEYFEITEGFSFTVAHNVPDQHSALFTLITQSGSEEWIMNFRIILNAPVLSFEDAFIVETTGNNNNRLDPGETVEIHIPFINEGHAMSSIGDIVMFSNHPQVTIEENAVLVPAVEALGTSYAIFTVSAAADIEAGSRVNFGFFAEFSSHQFQSGFEFPVGLMIEDFETGNLSAFNWSNISASPWEVTADEAYEGSFSVVSGTIQDNQTSTLSIERTLTAPGIISFWYKVSSENIHDKLQFYFNNAILNSWSGEIDWSYAEFNVPAGTHTFRWVYRKDPSGSEGQDCAWVDYITFPLSGGSEYNGPVFYTNTDAIDFSGSNINEVYSSQFTLVNFGNTLLQGTITMPEGFNVYLANNRNENLNYNIPANNNLTFNVVFRPTDNVDYSGSIILTSNDENATEYHIELYADLSSTSEAEIPVLATELLGNYPNPFNPETSIRFNLSNNQNVSISVYNVKGQLVKNIANEIFNMGSHSVVWNGTDSNNKSVSSGIYFYKFATPETVQVRKMMLIK